MAEPAKTSYTEPVIVAPIPKVQLAKPLTFALATVAPQAPKAIVEQAAA